MSEVETRDTLRQIAAQCRVVAALADSLSKVHSDYARIFEYGGAGPEDIADLVGGRTAYLMEQLEANLAHIARLDPQTVSSLATELLALRKRVGELEGALTPGAETKAAYIGEFTIAVARIVNDDEEPVDDGADAPDPYDHIQVPWTTIKQIMAAIRARASLSNTSEGGKDAV